MTEYDNLYFAKQKNGNIKGCMDWHVAGASVIG